MDVVELTGTYSEMGWQCGRNLSASDFAVPAASAEKLTFARDCAAVVSEYAPELVDELDAVAAASGLDRDLLEAFVLTLGEGPGCSVVAVAGRHTADGRGLFGRNFDFFEWDLPFQQLYRTYPTQAPGRWASAGCTDVLIGREDGVNEAGLVMAQTHVSGHTTQPGVLFSLVGRMVLDRCATVAEAVSLLETVPHVRANNWLLMDRGDQIAVVETCPEGVAACYATDGIAMITNHFRTPELGWVERVEERPADSHPRLCSLKAWWEQREGPVTEDDLHAVLSGHHDHGVCAHDDDQGLSTIRSLIMSPQDRQLQVVLGAPCRSGYARHEF
jgi:predicted choloylglycine hydrolase